MCLLVVLVFGLGCRLFDGFIKVVDLCLVICLRVFAGVMCCAVVVTLVLYVVHGF